MSRMSQIHGLDSDESIHMSRFQMNRIYDFFRLDCWGNFHLCIYVFTNSYFVNLFIVRFSYLFILFSTFFSDKMKTEKKIKERKIRPTLQIGGYFSL